MPSSQQINFIDMALLSLIIMQIENPDKSGHILDHDSLFMLISQITHPGPTMCHFQLLDIVVKAAPMD